MDVSKILFKKADIGDIPIIRGIAEIAFRDTYKDILLPAQMEYMMDWMYSSESLRVQMLEKENVFYILYVDGKAVGYSSFERYGNPPSDLSGEQVFKLQKLYILPEHQGQAYGKALLEFIEAQMLSAAGTATAYYELNVNRLNPAVSFYEKQGLSINRSGDFPIGHGYFMNDYIMRKKL